MRVGEALPSERELSAMTSISRVTVRKAIDTLLREGMLSRRPGSGTYVSTRIEQPASLLAGFCADMANRGSRPGSIWIEKVLANPTPEEAMTLAVSPDEQVVRMTRVRTADDEPLAIERAVVPAGFLPAARGDRRVALRRADQPRQPPRARPPAAAVVARDAGGGATC